MTKSRPRLPRLTAEVLEDRSVPAATFVNDNWHLFFDADNSGGLSANDLVSTGNDTGPLTVFTYGTQAFGTVTSGPGISGPTALPGFATINDAVAAAGAGGTVNVLAGTYVEDVTLNQAGQSLLGAGPGLSVISGAIGGSSSTVAVGASNVTVAGFTITREGNNPTDWTNPNLNSAGVSIQGQAITGTTVRDNLITGNRTGIDVNNSSGHTIRNNVISSNRTGLIFRNQTDNLLVTENAITGNFTVGIVFLDASGGTNSPPQQAANSTFTNNNISGNWYGQVVDRQTGGSLPAPGANVKNFSGNWFGTTTPVVTTANSAEPGYADLIPVQFGGTATAPGGQPDIAGPASANFDISPMLSSGTDTNVATAPGGSTFGFQGDFAALTVTGQLAQSGTSGRIQEGVDRVTTGGTVTVATGTYAENVTIGKNLTLLSAAGRAATTIQGVSGVGALGTVVLTNNTTGVTIGGAGKGFTIIGIDNGNPGIENAALYLQGGHAGTQIRGNDIRANGDEALLSEFGTTVSGIVIDGNIFSGQTFTGAAPATGNQFTVPNVARQLVVFGSGGGSATGPATNVTFTNNQITGTAGAAGAGNSLVTLDVANSTISGNTFAGATSGFGAALRVRRPGTTISGNTFNSANMTAGTEQLFVQNNTTPLEGIVAANTFDRGAYVNGGSDLSVSLAGGAGRAADGSTLRVLAGTYTESLDLTAAGVNKGLTLAPIGTATINGNLTLDANDALDFSAGQLIVTGTLTLGGATLTPALGGVGTVPAGGSVVILSVPGTAPVTGTFAGLPQGGTVTINGQTLTISYTGGDGNDVTLTAAATVTQPPVAAGATAGGSLAAPTTPAASPVITGAIVLNNLLMVFGQGGQLLTAFPVPVGTVAVFADFSGDGNGDLLVVSPALSFLVDGFTGKPLAVATDFNGDRIADVLLFSPTGAPQTLIFGGTGQQFSL